MANTTTAPAVNQSPRALLNSLRSEGWYSSFLTRVGRMEITPTEIRVDRATARIHNVPVKSLNEAAAMINLGAYLQGTFRFMGESLDGDMAKMIITDILDLYGWMSPLEIVKAINEGRQNPGDLYGKLSGRHVLEWLARYDSKMQQDLARYRQNEKHRPDPSVDQVITAAMENQRKPEKKREYTHEEKVQALKERYESISEEERQRREYLRAWSLQEHGDFQVYAQNYKPKN